MTDRATYRLELKFAQDGETGAFEGVASAYGITDRGGDIVAPGAFTASIAEHRANRTRPALLFGHDPLKPIGVVDEIIDSPSGLSIKGRFALDTADGRDAHALAKMGGLQGLSIGYLTKRATRDAKGIRTILVADLLEISAVTIPMNPRTVITNVKAAGAANEGAKAMTLEELAALAEEQKAKIAELETKAGKVDDLEKKAGKVDDLEKKFDAAQKRADNLELKMNRPGAGAVRDEAKELEKKAFFSFARHGREGMGADEIKALRVSDSTAGGYLAPEQFVAELDRNLVVTSPIRSIARVAGTANGNVLLPKRTGAMTAAWTGETESKSPTSPGYGATDLEVRELSCYVDVSNQLLEDAGFDIATELAYDFAEEFGRAEGAAFVSGDGNKKPLGFLNTSGIGVVKTGAAANFAASNPFDNIFDLFYALPTAYAARASFGMNRSTMGVVRKFKDGQGRYLWADPIAEGQTPTILGRPVVEMPDMPDVGANALPIVFGDFSNFRIFDRIALSILRDPYSQQTSGLVRFHGRRRLAAGVTKTEAFKFLKCST